MISVSIVIPVYKVGKYIENSIRSVISQKFKDFEVILVDNNTPDDSIEIASQLLDNTDIPYRIVKQTKQGLPAARNRGIEVAQGEWVISIDPDDTISSLFIKELFECANNNEIDVVFSKYNEVGTKDLFVFHEESKPDCIEIINRDDVLKRLLVRSLPLMVSNMFFRRSFFVSHCLKFDEEVILGADLLLLWRLLAYVDKVAYINKYLYNHYTREDSLMTAPSEEKVYSNLAGYKRQSLFVSDHYSEKFSSWIYAREVFALLSTMSQFADYRTYSAVYHNIYNDQVHSGLSDFPDKKIRIMNKALLPFPRAFFRFTRFIRNNPSIARLLHGSYVK